MPWQQGANTHEDNISVECVFKPLTVFSLLDHFLNPSKLQWIFTVQSCVCVCGTYKRHIYIYYFSEIMVAFHSVQFGSFSLYACWVFNKFILSVQHYYRSMTSTKQYLENNMIIKLTESRSRNVCLMSIPIDRSAVCRSSNSPPPIAFLRRIINLSLIHPFIFVQPLVPPSVH